MRGLIGIGLIGVGLVAGYGASAAVPIRDLFGRTDAQRTCPWPAQLDAVRAAPRNHRIVLENDRVRVLDVTVSPGEREELHAHCLPSVMYLMQEGKYRDFDGNGRLIEEVTQAAPASEFPMTLWLEPQAPHAVHNLDTKPTRLLRIELKD